VDPRKTDRNVDHDDILIDIVCVLHGDVRNQVKLERLLRCVSTAESDTEESGKKKGKENGLCRMINNVEHDAEL